MGLLISVVIVLAVAGVLALALRKPDEFRTARTIEIAAPAQVIFDHISDVHKNHQWSPWVAMEPDAEYAFERPEQGEGAIVRWTGKRVGKGASTIVEARAPEFVKNRLDFEKPFKSTSHATFDIVPKGNVCGVTWAMYGENKLPQKIMSVFINCEDMVGGQFESGLRRLKETCEKAG